MKYLLDKLSTYNILNYLLPGAIWAYWLTHQQGIQVIQENILYGLFVYYFLGMIVSRFGSIMLEPILKKLGWVNYAAYPQYLSASKLDPTIEVLSETNNIYRTFISLFALVLLFEVFFELGVPSKHYPLIAASLLLILFLLSYRKQTRFVRERVEKTNKLAETQPKEDQLTQSEETESQS